MEQTTPEEFPSASSTTTSLYAYCVPFTVNVKFDLKRAEEQRL